MIKRASKALNLNRDGQPPKADKLADSVLILLTLTVVQRLVGFGRSVLFCLWLGAEDLGEWDIGFSFLMLAAPVAVLSLPGAFGRYVAYYRQRGQLRLFLRRTIGATAILATATAAAIVANRVWFSGLVFGRGDRVELVLLLTGALLSTIAYNVVVELLISLRLQRLASTLEFFNSLAFAGLGVGLLWCWQASAASVIGAYGGACLLSVLVSLVWARDVWRWLPEAEGPPVGQFALWTKIVPFIAALWASNWLGNLFNIADRYVLIHFSQWDAAESLAMVGQYHSSRILPLLLITVCGLLGSVVTPFLSHEWEAGNRRLVAARLNLLLKLAGLTLVSGSVVMLWLSPLLFGWVFRGKFDVAPAILALALAYSVWAGMVCLAKTFLWCAEKAALVSIAYLAGLATSVGLNLFLVPRFGLVGAVNGACAAHLVVLLVVYAFNRRHGMHLDRGVWLVSALPLALWLGPWCAAAGVLLFLAASAWTNLIFNAAEKTELISGGLRYVAGIKGHLERGRLAPAAVE